MRVLARAVRARGADDEPLPQALPALAELGFVQRRGQLSLWVAGPGVGKSIIALNIALLSEVPTLYASADTDLNDQADRVTAFFGGKDDALGQVPLDCRFEFDSSPTPHDLGEMAEAFGLLHGEHPHLIIVDTLGKVWTDVGDEVARNKESIDRCQQLARDTGAHVMVLHHLTKGFDRGDTVPSLDGVMGGVTKIPEQVVGLWRQADNCLGVNVLKNRSGKADPTGQHVKSYMNVDYDAMRLTALVPQTLDLSGDHELQGLSGW